MASNHLYAGEKIMDGSLMMKTILLENRALYLLQHIAFKIYKFDNNMY